MPKLPAIAPTRRPVVLAERFRLERALEGGRHEAVDLTKGGIVIVTRAVFGPSRRADRDAFIERVRALWTVTAPALVLPIDSGEWDDDAYVVEERVEAPFAALAVGLAGLDAYERASAARNLAEAIAVLHAAGFVHGSLTSETVLLDGYRQPKVHAAVIATLADAESERAEDRTLRALLDEIAPGCVVSAAEGATAGELARCIVISAAGPSSPLVVVAEGTRSRGLLALAIALALIALVAIGLLLGR